MVVVKSVLAGSNQPGLFSTGTVAVFASAGFLAAAARALCCERSFLASAAASSATSPAVNSVRLPKRGVRTVDQRRMLADGPPLERYAVHGEHALADDARADVVCAGFSHLILGAAYARNMRAAANCYRDRASQLGADAGALPAAGHTYVYSTESQTHWKEWGARMGSDTRGWW